MNPQRRTALCRFDKTRKVWKVATHLFPLHDPAKVDLSTISDWPKAGYTNALVGDISFSRRIKTGYYKEIILVPIEIDGQTYYRTSETCKKSGISRATLFRWLKAGILEKSYRDRRGWRMFTEEDLNKIRTEARRIEVEYDSP